jgi:hypothetical protein
MRLFGITALMAITTPALAGGYYYIPRPWVPPASNWHPPFRPNFAPPNIPWQQTRVLNCCHYPPPNGR